MTLDNILKGLKSRKHKYIAQAISSIENNDEFQDGILNNIQSSKNKSIRIGITGPPGAGKSSITNQLIKKYRSENKSVCAPSQMVRNSRVFHSQITLWWNGSNQLKAIASGS